VVLFFLLKVRMEPLLSLRSMIKFPAKGTSDLSHRAAVKSHDEFGELARDLNLFLDRIDHVVEDLGHILTRVMALNHRLNQVQTQMQDEYAQAESQLRAATEQLLDTHSRTVAAPAQWLNAMTLAVASLQSLAAERSLPKPLQNKLQRCVTDLETFVACAPGDLQQEDTGQQLLRLARRFRDFSHFMTEMAVLEEKMGEIAEVGQVLLNRLRSVEKVRDVDPHADITQ
jgi:methyl-accepting chemotaxis protein